MMNKKVRCVVILSVLGVIYMTIGACAESRTEIPEGVTLVDASVGHAWLAFDVKKWGAILGPHGFVSPQFSVDYRFYLDGPGPVFQNPKYVGFGSDIYTGTVTLDREHNRVVIDMYRVVSKDGEALKTEPHPVNGIHVIDKVMQADQRLLPKP